MYKKQLYEFLRNMIRGFISFMYGVFQMSKMSGGIILEVFEWLA